MSLPLEMIIAAVERGLTSERTLARMEAAKKARDFFNFEGLQHMTSFWNHAGTLGRMGAGKKARDFFNVDGLQHMNEFWNGAETGPEFIRRKYRESGLA